MQIIVLGAGAIGSLFGAKLAATNHVTLVARAAHVEAINTAGLRIEGTESQIVRLQASTKVNEVPDDALIVLTTKVADTRAALVEMATMVWPDTTVLVLQNGLGGEEIAREVLQDRGVVLRGVTQAGAIFDRAGVVHYMAVGETALEPHERSRRICDLFNAAGLACRISENIAAEVWRKLVVNCVVNPITTMLRQEVGAIADPRLVSLKQLVVDECRAVARREGVSVDDDILQQIDSFFAPSQNIVSMQQDLLRGRATEIDYMNGAVVKLGAQHGIDCPVNAALTAIIKAMEAQRSLVPEKMLEPQPA